MSVSPCTTMTASSHIYFRQVFMHVGCDQECVITWGGNEGIAKHLIGYR